jgi:hypothetical protein
MITTVRQDSGTGRGPRPPSPADHRAQERVSLLAFPPETHRPIQEFPENPGIAFGRRKKAEKFALHKEKCA